MLKNSSLHTIVLFVFLIVLVIGGSIVIDTLWSGESEKLPDPDRLQVDGAMTIGQFGQANDLPKPVLKQLFSLQSEADLQKKLSEYGSSEEVRVLISKKLALASENASKNWIKILVKFILWFIFLISTFIFLKKRKITSTLRKWLLFFAVVIFGVVMGSDPSPMGTVKDAIHLFAAEQVIFVPRMIALTVFLLIVFLFNKYICAWGCQLGTLQDLIFRINRSNHHKAIIGKQFKLPFVITNSIRILFLLIFTAAALAWAVDIIEPIDPFKLFNPLSLGILGGGFGVIIILSSLFIYRPWCHFFCPFGLVGWLVEKISVFRIRVDYNTCIACQKCVSACPSTVMSAILKKNKKTIPDCFSCYTCIEVCPTNSISFSVGKRTRPPQGHFDKKEHNA